MVRDTPVVLRAACVVGIILLNLDDNESVSINIYGWSDGF